MNEGAPGGESLLAVGNIIRPHGLRGAVIVLAESDFPGRFEPGTRLVLETPAGQLRETTVVSAGPHKNRLLVQLEGINDRDAAEALKGGFLLVPESEAAPLGEGEYWAHELAGMAVTDQHGRGLGVVAQVLCGEAQDSLVVRRAGGEEFMVPFVNEFVLHVDPRERVVRVKVIRGMIE